MNSDSSDPQDIASRIKKELLDDFGASANNPLITHIKTGFEEYGQSDSHIRVPDLVVEYIDGVMTIINPSESKYIRRYDELNKQPGTHARDGIFIFKGSGIKAGLKTKAEIVDILPTLMAHIGLPFLLIWTVRCFWNYLRASPVFSIMTLTLIKKIRRTIPKEIRQRSKNGWPIWDICSTLFFVRYYNVSCLMTRFHQRQKLTPLHKREGSFIFN